MPTPAHALKPYWLGLKSLYRQKSNFSQFHLSSLYHMTGQAVKTLLLTLCLMPLLLLLMPRLSCSLYADCCCSCCCCLCHSCCFFSLSTQCVLTAAAPAAPILVAVNAAAAYCCCFCCLPAACVLTAPAAAAILVTAHSAAAAPTYPTFLQLGCRLCHCSICLGLSTFKVPAACFCCCHRDCCCGCPS